jgi:predicted Zn-dependent peptidase
VLDNGLTVLVQENHSNPTIAVSGRCFRRAPSTILRTSGLASFTASQLSRGTATRSLLDIARTLEDVGASASIYAN